MKRATVVLFALPAFTACESHLDGGQVVAPHTLIADGRSYDTFFQWSAVPGARYVIYVSSSPGVTTDATRFETTDPDFTVVSEITNTPCARVAAVAGGVESELSAEVCGRRNLGAFGPDAVWNAPAGTQSLRGSSLAAGDVDGDGWPDLVVGDPGWDDGVNLDAGRVTLHLGRATGPSSDAWELVPGVAGMEAGAAVAVGDYDMDGIDDVFVGAPGADQVLGFRGRAGSAPSATPSWTYTPGETNRRFGSALAVTPPTVEDEPRLIVGAPGQSEAFVYRAEFGFERGLDSTVGNEYGASIAIGDLDGDDQVDLVIGAPADAGSGAIFVHYGLGGTPVKLSIADAGARFGAHVGIGATVEGTPAVLGSAPDYGDSDQGGIVHFAPDGAGSFTPVDEWMGSSTNLHRGLAMLPYTPDIDRSDVPNVVFSNARGDVDWCEVRDAGLNCLSGYVYGEEAHGFGAALAAADLNGDGRLDLAVGSPSAPEGSAAVSVFAGSSGAPRAMPGQPLTVWVGETAQPLDATFDDAPGITWARCAWSWGDGSPETVIEPCHPATAGSVTHVYEIPGSYPLRLRVEANGRFGEGVTTVTVR